MHTVRRAVIGAAAILLMGACTGAEAGGKAGGAPPPVVLKLGTAENEGTPGYAMAERFAAAVSQRSGDALRVELTTTDGRPDGLAWDQASIEAMTDGEIDLVLAPARAWHSVGVRTLEALQLPGLIESDEQADRVVRGEAVPGMLAGLDAVDAVGLALFPEGHRHIATYGSGAVTADSLTGARVRAPLAETPWATLRALGAVPLDIADPGEALANGEIDAVETSLALLANLPPAPSMTTNVALYYKFQVLAASEDSLAELDEDQRQDLRDGAQDAVDQTLADRPRAGDAVRDACAQGVSLVEADEAAVTQIRAIFARVTQDASADPAVGELVESVRQDAGPVGGGVLTGCDAPPPRRPVVVPEPGDLPDGTYRIDVTSAMLREVGVTDPEEIRINVGVFTFVLEGGEARWEQQTAPDVNNTEGSAVYAVTGDRLLWQWGPNLGSVVVPMRWSVEPDGSLVFAPNGEIPEPGWQHLFMGPLERVE